jgi:hypothetical protein
MTNQFIRVTHARAGRSAPWNHYISLVVRGIEDGREWVATGMGKTDLTPETIGVQAQPLVTLSDTEAQVLMDDLWACGLRPSEGSGSAGALAATQAHLKDMQTIAFKLLEPKPHV